MSPIRMSKIESAVRTVIEFNEATNRHDVERMLRLVSDDCVIESFRPAPDGTIYSGKDEAARYWRDFFARSPEAHIEIEDIFGLGKRCVMRWRYRRATKDGDSYVRGVDIYRINDGVILEQLSFVKG